GERRRLRGEEPARDDTPDDRADERSSHEWSERTSAARAGFRRTDAWRPSHTRPLERRDPARRFGADGRHDRRDEVWNVLRDPEADTLAEPPRALLECRALRAPGEMAVDGVAHAMRKVLAVHPLGDGCLDASTVHRRPPPR